MDQTRRRPRHKDSPESWAAFKLSRGLSYKDVALLLGISKQAAHRRYRRAVDELAEALVRTVGEPAEGEEGQP